MMFIPLYGITIQFDDENSIEIDTPSNWKTEQDKGTPLPEMGSTFDIRLTAPINEKTMLIITVGKTLTGKPLTQRQMNDLTKKITTNYLRESVEKRASFVDVPVRGGKGKYAIFTDASLINKRPRPDEYLYAVLFLVNYDNGCFVYATGLTDDTSGAGFQNMVKSISSMEPSLAVIVQTPPVQIQITREGALISNAASRLKLLIPSKTLKKMPVQGGRQNNPGYFYFEDTKDKLLISGWLEPVEKFKHRTAREFWDSRPASREQLNPLYAKIGDWDVFLYDLPLPEIFRSTGASAHLQANLLQENAWIDLHLSRTDAKPSETLRNELIEYLKTLEIQK